jgi:hypothetical protein
VADAHGKREGVMEGEGGNEGGGSEGEWRVVGGEWRGKYGVLFVTPPSNNIVQVIGVLMIIKDYTLFLVHKIQMSTQMSTSIQIVCPLYMFI